MKKKLIGIVTLLCILFLLLNCGNSKKKIITIKFENKSNVCDENGLPIDSSIIYFPIKLFHDTLQCILDSNRIYRLHYWGSKEEYAKQFNIKVESLKDSFEIAEDSVSYVINSFMLFKMKEPILSNQYLNREIYRLIVLRSFDKPLTITFDNYYDSCVITVKQLNRGISYPFIQFGGMDSVVFCAPNIAGYDTTLGKTIIYNEPEYHKIFISNKKSNDSLARLYNNTNYFLTKNSKLRIKSSYWDTLQAMIDSANYWRTKPNVALDYMQCDGSQWIIEGHSKYGYQIQIIPNPNFDNADKKNSFDDKNKFAKIFKFIMKIANLENEEFY